VRYLEIADDLRRRVAAGDFNEERVLPSEAELGAAYEASRVTVRKALEALRADGLLDARQGYGWFVSADPLRQTLGRLATIESQLAASGVEGQRRILDFGFVRPPRWIADVLGPGNVLRVRRVNLADGEPFARVTVWCPEELGSSLSRDQVEASSFYELLPIELAGATQTIGAGACSVEDADVLGVATGSPVLVCRRTTKSEAGVPVLLSEHVFAAHRTEFVVELPHVGESMAPDGLQLTTRSNGRSSRGPSAPPA
jgi:GntR family transcriptional regulator